MPEFRFAAPELPGTLEQALFTPFVSILQSDITGVYSLVATANMLTLNL